MSIVGFTDANIGLPGTAKRRHANSIWDSQTEDLCWQHLKYNIKLVKSMYYIFAFPHNKGIIIDVTLEPYIMTLCHWMLYAYIWHR